MGGLTAALCKGVALTAVSFPLEGLAHLVRCCAWVLASSWAVVVGWSWKGHVVFFWGVGVPLESQDECGFGRGLVSGICALGAERICGFLIVRWNPD